MKKIVLVFFLFFLFLLPLFSVKADELDDIESKLNDFKRSLELSLQATKPLEVDIQKLNKELADIKSRVSVLEKEIVKKQKEVEDGEKVLTYQKTLLEERTKSHYKNIGKNTSSLIELLVSDNLSVSLNNFFYQKYALEEDKKTIIKIVLYIKNLEEKKKDLESEKTRLDQIKQEVDKQAGFLSGEITKAKTYQNELRQKIAELTGRQQQLLAQKLASLNISRSASTLGACDSDLTNGRDPGFSPRFAFFTFGVPNRTGMNQWGAWGRAKAGQNEEQILQAYYDNFELKKDYDKGINIHVVDSGIDTTLSIEEYVKRIYEMPSDWVDNNLAALKAQAIAARSYALAYTNNGAGSICATQNCQVFKNEPKGGAWEQAVNDTAGWVMVSGGQPVKAWYSSTHGGFVLKSSEIGWSDTAWTKHATDTRESASGLADLRDSNKAYDKESPWFYCDWGSRGEYNKTAWLKPQELADIVNALLLAKRDGSSQSHLSQVDKSNPDGVETWNQEKVKEELRGRGGNPYNSISEVSADGDTNSGRTTSVRVSGDGGDNSFDGAEFKNFFNLRAPGNIQIVGPLYNVEKR